MLPNFWKTLTSWAAAVSHCASAVASAVCLPDLGTARNEPPQLPACGGWAMSHLPLFAGPELVATMPVIQLGQAMVANLPVLNAADQVLLESNCCSLAVRPSWT